MAKVIDLGDKVSADVSNDTDNEEYERYIPVEQSIIIALNQVREIQAGRLPKKGWRELFAELDKEIKLAELEEISKRISVNLDTLKRRTANALIEDGKYFVVPELTYKNFENNPNWRPCFYIVDKEYKFVRIGIEFAKEIARSEKFIECTKDEVIRWRKKFRK